MFARACYRSAISNYQTKIACRHRLDQKVQLPNICGFLVPTAKPCKLFLDQRPQLLATWTLWVRLANQSVPIRGPALEEKSLATYIANKSTQIYNFGNEVSDQECACLGSRRIVSYGGLGYQKGPPNLGNPHTLRRAQKP